MSKPVTSPPEDPSRVQEVLTRHLRQRSPEVDRALDRADTAKGYQHWEDFRHRKTPEGWSAQDLWLLLAITRRPRRQLPLLRTKTGEPFGIHRSDPMVAALHRLDMREELWKSLSLAGEGPGSEVSYRLMAAIEEAHHSSAIEGAVTTRRRSRELIRAGAEPRNESERMVLNNFRTLERLTEWIESPLVPETVSAIHASVTQGTLAEGDVGRIRTDDDVRVWDRTTNEILHVPPRAKELPDRMERLCAFANAPDTDEDFLHPVVRAILLHHQLAYDHPFADGNGRTARALFLWGILRAGYAWFRSLSISRAVHRAQSSYYRSFLHVQSDRGDTTYFVRHQLRCIEREVEHLAEFLRRRARLESWVRTKDAVSGPLNTRQLALLEYALEHPEEGFTAKEHRQYHGVTQPTAWKDLTSMVEQGLLDERKAGRKSVYFPSRKLRRLAAERPSERTRGV